jgi:hypothetical protein
MNIKTAVVIRSYSKRIRFLKRALESLKYQTFKNIVVCILNMNNETIHNDGYFSTNSTSELFKYLDDMEIKYISILDDDDTLSPEFFSRLISVLDSLKYPSVKAITTHVNNVFEYMENNRVRISRTEPLNHHLKSGVLSIDTLRYRDVLVLSSFIFNYKSFKEIIYMHDLNNPAFFWPFIIHFGIRFDIWILEEPMAFKHIREISSYNESNYSTKSLEKFNLYIRLKFHELYRLNELSLNTLLTRLVFH